MKDAKTTSVIMLKEELQARKEKIHRIITEKRKCTKSAPEGGLRIVKRKYGNQYYWRKVVNDTNGVYIPKKDIQIAQRLAQKDYDSEILRMANKELKIINEYLAILDCKTVETVYGTLNEPRRILVKPVIPTDEEYVLNWMDEQYDRMAFSEETEEHYSANGIRVRSKSEEIIANLLEHYKIPYKYEYPLHLERGTLVRPDFICLNVPRRKEMVWEHFGMMDNEEYANKNIQKISFYEHSGYIPGENMILTFESSQVPLNSNVVRSKIERYLLQ